VTAPRFTLDALPAYSFVPGQFPHPHSDADGHRFGSGLPPADAVDPDRWASSRHYLLGIDLFNCGYYWEAHEIWEAAWNASGRAGPVANVLKALIQLAVVGVKARQGMPDSAVAHARRAAELLQQVRNDTGQAHLLGLDLAALEMIAETLAERPPLPRVGGPVEVHFEFALLPSGAAVAPAQVSD
jgi:uncharacterized protein